LGRLYAQKNDVARSETALFHASWLDIHDTEALRLIVQIRMRQSRFEEAAQTQRRAVARQPDEPRQYILLSDILEKMGRTDEARTTVLLDEIVKRIGNELVDPRVHWLRTHDPMLAETLRAYLDSFGDIACAASVLHVHANTVRYRISRVEALTGRDLSALADRVDFFLALRGA